MIEENITDEEVFHPFVAFSDPSESADGDQIEIQLWKKSIRLQQYHLNSTLQLYLCTIHIRYIL